MYMPGSGRVFFQHLQIILAAVCQMAAVKQQAHQLRIRVFHHPVNLRSRLHHGSHVVMECQRYSYVLSHFPQFVQACAQKLPLLIVHHIFIPENGFVRALYGMSLLGHTHHLCTHLFQESDVLEKTFLGLFVGLCGEKGGVPGVTYLHPPKL